MGGSEGAETTRVADRPVSAQTRVNIPDSIAEIAKRTLAKVPEAHAIVLFGSRARGDADGTSDWDLMVRSHAMLPHNLMVLEGIIPKDGWVGRGERVQSVSLSDYEALHHTGEVQSLAVAWSRDGTVIAGADALIEHAQKKHLHMNDVILLEMNQKALAQIRRSWNDIRIGHEPGATPDQKLQPGPTVVDACELVTRLAMYGYEILGAKIHKLHKLANHPET